MKNTTTALREIDRVIAAGPFDPTWESLGEYRVPRWYKDQKFGIFIHWGVYSVPAYGNEWYPRNMYMQGSTTYHHHRERWGDHKKFGYKDFIPLFKAENYDPAEWAELFEQSGARFVVPVAEHHDGFAMYDCGFTKWKATGMGPCRDTTGELAQAVRARGMTFGVSSHRAENWFFFEGGRAFPSDVQDSKYAGLYGFAQPRASQPNKAHLDDWLARTCELVDLHRPQIVWFDWWIEEPAFEPYLKRFAAFYYNRAVEWGVEVAINYKHRAYLPGTAVFDLERGQQADIHPLLWQTDTAVSKNSWGYVAGQDYKPAGTIVQDLVDIVSKNGVLLLNIGPRPDGTIPEPDQAILQEIGKWLRQNGESVYDTRPWKVFGEGPTEVKSGQFTDRNRWTFTAQDVRFTTAGDALYATLMGWPADGKLTIKTLAESSKNAPLGIRKVRLLANDRPIKFTRDAEGLHLQLPGKPVGEHAFVLKITG